MYSLLLLNMEDKIIILKEDSRHLYFSLICLTVLPFMLSFMLLDLTLLPLTHNLINITVSPFWVHGIPNVKIGEDYIILQFSPNILLFF